IGSAQVVAISASTGRTFFGNFFVGETGFGLFSLEKNGSGPALAQITRQNVSLMGLTNPVRSGDWVTLSGTGLGDAATGDVIVDILGRRVSAAFAGSSGEPGVDQVNFKIPAGVPEDCYVPVAVEVRGSTRPSLSLSVANSGGACNHRLGLT